MDKEIRQSENTEEILLNEGRMGENESENGGEDESEDEIGSGANMGSDEKWMEWRAKAKESVKRRKNVNKLRSVAELSHPQVREMGGPD